MSEAGSCGLKSGSTDCPEENWKLKFLFLMNVVLIYFILTGDRVSCSSLDHPGVYTFGGWRAGTESYSGSTELLRIIFMDELWLSSMNYCNSRKSLELWTYFLDWQTECPFWTLAVQMFMSFNECHFILDILPGSLVLDLESCADGSVHHSLRCRGLLLHDLFQVSAGNFLKHLLIGKEMYIILYELIL